MIDEVLWINKFRTIPKTHVAMSFRKTLHPAKLIESIADKD